MLQPTALGVIPEPEHNRDAIHIAVFPAIATGTLFPAQRVDIERSNAIPSSGEGIGIVDPFLTHPVPSGTTSVDSASPGNHQGYDPSLDSLGSS